MPAIFLVTCAALTGWAPVGVAPRAPALVQRAARLRLSMGAKPSNEQPNDERHDLDAFRGRDLERDFASFKTGGRRLNSKIFRLPGVRALYLFGASLRDRSRSTLSIVQRGASSIPAYQQLLILNLIVFALQSTLLPTLTLACSRINALILRRNQVHRLITPIFLHADVRHLLFNSLSLANIGSAVEQTFGTKRFLLIYLASGIAGNLVGLEYGGNTPSVGASGAVFGLLGAMLVWVRRTQELGMGIGSSIAQSLFMSVVFGLLPRRGVDQWAHVGGLIGGLLVGAIFAPWRWGERRQQASGRGYIIATPSSSAPFAPEWLTDLALAAVVGAVVLACAYGLDFATTLQHAHRFGFGTSALRRALEQPPRRPGLWRWF